MAGILGSHRSNIMAGASLILFALVSMAYSKQVSSQAGNTPPRASFPIGQYKLDTRVETVTGLTEFSAAEYAVMGRQFEGEKNYNAAPVTFLGRQWKLQLGTVNGRIYKIAPFLQLKDKKDANVVAMDTALLHRKNGKAVGTKNGLIHLGRL